MGTVELQFGALPVHVRTARLVAAAIARRIGVDESLIDEVKLAVGEACSRAVDVHRQHQPDEFVTVLFDDADDVFTVAVLDSGPAGEQVAGDGDRPDVVELMDSVGARGVRNGSTDVETGDPQSTDPQITDPQITVSDDGAAMPSGLGLALIQGLVDDVSIAQRADGIPGTRVTMSWPAIGDFPGSDFPGSGFPDLDQELNLDDQDLGPSSKGDSGSHG